MTDLVKARDYVRTQLRLPQPPSSQWLVSFLIDNFGYDSESAPALVKEVRARLAEADRPVSRLELGADAHP